MKPLRFYLASVACAVILFSCSKSNESDLGDDNGSTPGGNNSGCDTSNMKFAANIKPILSANCYSCHSNANFAVSGVKLEDYDDVKNRADDGKLIGVITHAAGYPPMPQGGAKLSECNINKIRSWIDHGALNN
jgi:hypothetical protein